MVVSRSKETRKKNRNNINQYMLHKQKFYTKRERFVAISQ